MSGIPVYLETFGCQMNELDSELVRGQLQRLGYAFVDRPEDAQVVLFNTCSVREHAESKAYSRIGLVGQRKAAGERVLLGVLGCMAERDGLDMLRRHPQVDVLCGPGELDRLPALLDAARRSEAASQAERVALAGNRSRRTATLHAVQDDLETLDLSRAFDPDAAGRARHVAQVRITRGCNKFCTYCVVPYTRGAEVHRPPDHIVDECRRLADAGAIEVTLLGQTVNHYRYTHGTAVTVGGREAPQVGPGLRAFRDGARDSGAPRASGVSAASGGPGSRVTTFADLLRRIHEEVPAIQRLRFVTSYPRDFGPDILAVMRDSPRICRYLHAPAQSGSDAVLARMNRGYTVGEYEEFVARVFEALPDATLAGDIIVGFPGETDADFEATCALVRRLPFKNNFIFKYSPRPGTTAIDRFPDDVPDEVKRWRNNALLAIQGETSARVHAAWVGRRVPVLFDGVRQGASAGAGPGAGIGTGSGVGAVGGGVQLRVGGVSVGSGSPRPDAGWQSVGRTPGDLIVAVPAADERDARSRLGSAHSVRIASSQSLLLRGEIGQ